MTPSTFFCVQNDPHHNSSRTLIQRVDLQTGSKVTLDMTAVLPGAQRAVISGITSKWILVSLVLPDTPGATVYGIYLVSYDGQQTVRLGQSREGYAWYYPADGRIYAVNQHIGGNFVIQAFNPVTGQLDTVFDRTDTFTDSWVMIWYNTYDGRLIFRSLTGTSYMLLIEAGKPIVLLDEASAADGTGTIPFLTPPPATAAEQALAADTKVHAYALTDTYLYTLERADDASYSYNFYRMNPDMSGKTLLEANTDLVDLCFVGGTLFGLRDDLSHPDEFGNGVYTVQALDAGGQSTGAVLYQISSDQATGNSVLRLQAMSGLLVARWSYIYSGNSVGALVDPANGRVLVVSQTR